MLSAVGPHQAGRGAFHHPLDDVDPVRHQVGEAAAAEIPEEAPAAVLEGVERLFGGRAEPLFPVQPGGVDPLLGQGQPVLMPVAFDQRDLS